ncbi:unnamed protein product [Prunus brigantina]
MSIISVMCKGPKPPNNKQENKCSHVSCPTSQHTTIIIHSLDKSLSILPVIEVQAPLKELLEEWKKNRASQNPNTTAGRVAARSTCYHRIMPNCHRCNKGISQVHHAMQGLKYR